MYRWPSACQNGRKFSTAAPARRFCERAYERADCPEFRDSDYYVVPVSDAARLKAALGYAMGLRLSRALAIRSDDRISVSYSDLLFEIEEAVLGHATAE